jgi:3-hydroxyacyl-[acyl-carrier-protein] dehydratase
MEFSTLVPSELLPHKKPMLLIDKIIETDYEKEITAETFLEEDLVFFKGHFDGYPILPGVIMIEMMFQVCGILNRISKNGGSQSETPKIGKAVKIKSATFIKEARPNDTLTIKAEKINSILNFSNYNAQIYIGNELICKAEVTVTLISN